MSGLYRWAPPTWKFFHTFAAKVNKQFFEANRDQCLSIIKMTCSCLPCVTCTGHATAFMKTVNGNNIKTKEDLIHMLFTFHNIVNRRLGKSQFSKESLVIYNSYRMDIVLVNFIRGHSATIMSGITSTLGKRRSNVKAIIDWMKANWIYFQT